jgi:hypothetical protein
MEPLQILRPRTRMGWTRRARSYPRTPGPASRTRTRIVGIQRVYRRRTEFRGDLAGIGGCGPRCSYP